METPYLYLLISLPPVMALTFAWFAARSVRKSAAEIDAAREALRRRQSHAAE